MLVGSKPSPLSLFKASLIASMLVAGALQTSVPHKSLVNRAQRLLQSGTTTTGYTITPSPDVKTNCDDQGISPSSLSISVAERDALQAEFSGSTSPLVDALNANVGTIDYSGMATKAAAGPLGVAAAFCILSLLSLFFLFFWSLFECCCKRTCCIKDEPGKPRSTCRVVCWIFGAAVGVATVGVVIGWVVSLGKVAGGAKDVKCAITILYSDVVMGTTLETGGKFAGTTGIGSLLSSYITFINDVTTIQSDATTVKNKNLNTKGTDAVSKYATFKTSFSGTAYNYKGSKTTSATVVPNIATSMKAAIDSSAFETEVNQLNSTAYQIHTAVSQIASYDTASLASVKSSLTSMNSALSTSLETPITNMYNSVAGKNSPDYGASVASAMKTFMIVSIIVVVLFTVAYLVILYFTAKLNKLHGLKVISKVIMLLQLLLGTVILVFAIIGSLLCIAIVIACAVLDGVITTEGYLGKISTDPQMIKIMTNCVHRTAGGDLLKALGADLTQIYQISNISSGMQSYQNISGNLTNQSAPYVGGVFATNISNYLAGDEVARGTPTSEDVQTGLDYFKTLGCAQDVIQPKTCPAGYTQSTNAHTVSTGVNTNYCFNFLTMPSSVTNYGTLPRYTAPCTGTGTLTAAAGGAALQTVYDSINDYRTKTTSLQTFYNTNFYTAESTLFTEMKNSITQLEKINSKITGVTTTLNNLNGTLTAVADCTVMRKEIIMVENVLCYRVGSNFIAQNALATAVGSLLFFYAWFICCGIRLATKIEEQNPNAVSPAFDKMGDQSGAMQQPYQQGYPAAQGHPGQQTPMMVDESRNASYFASPGKAL